MSSDQIRAARAAGLRDLEGWQNSRPDDFFAADPFFRAVLDHHLGVDAGGRSAELHGIGQLAAGPVDDLAYSGEQPLNLPQVGSCDSLGRPTEEVIFHPDYHDLGRLWWGTGVVSVLSEPGHETVCGAIAYLLGHAGEAGHACPVACTVGAVKLIGAVGSDEQRERYLPLLLDPDYDSCWRASQFVTELQGGSDVGANTTVALPDAERDGWYRLTGEKWFCSVADADLFVVTARTPEGDDGTAGLGLFLVPRLVDGAPNGFRLRRLKDKLGTRSMATGEIELEGALGEPVGALADGFRNLISIVLDTSRVHNALSACSAMRRAYVEAWTYAHHRHAFGVPLAALPPVERLLARIRRRLMAGTAATFRILAATDAIATDAADADAVATRRIDVMINKYWTALASTAAVHDAIEVFGGNGTVEDYSPLPRLYRDTIVMESWEGPHNTLCAQILRDFRVRALHQPWLRTVRAQLDALGAGGTETAALWGHLERVEEHVHDLVDGDERSAAALIRPVVDDMARIVECLALLELGESSEIARTAAELHRLEELDRVDRLGAPRLLELEEALAAAL